MSSIANHENFLSANKQYVDDFGEKGKLPTPPGKKLIIVTCMDARINPAAHLGLAEGDAHIIRNAGGSAEDALRSIIISQRLLGTREIAVFHHTGCGMLTFKNEDLHATLKAAHPDAAQKIDSINFLPFPDLDSSVRKDVQYLREEELILSDSTITGWVYEVETGKIRKVE